MNHLEFDVWTHRQIERDVRNDERNLRVLLQQEMMTSAGLSFVSASDSDVKSLFTRFLLTNHPFVLKDVIPSWSCWKRWRNEDGTLKLAAFLAEFGDCVVPVVKSNVSGGYGEEKREEFPLRTAFASLLDDSTPVSPIYAKDWHVVRDCPGNDIYTCPAVFADDWLNWWWDHKCAADPTLTKDDYRFMYIGTKGSCTWLHHDVLNSNSWSGNVVGRKYWLLFPPTEAHKLYDKWGRDIVKDARPMKPSTTIVPSEDIDPGIDAVRWREESTDTATFPLLHTARPIEYIQQPGDILFVPSGWHHQVHNIDNIVLSINHNWFNASTLPSVWAFLQRELAAVRAAIADCRSVSDSSVYDDEWEWTCQKVMRANCTVDYIEWVALLMAKGVELISSIDACSEGTDNSIPLFSLAQLQRVLQQCHLDPFVSHNVEYWKLAWNSAVIDYPIDVSLLPHEWLPHLIPSVK